MTDFDKMSRRDFFTITGKAGLATLAASAVGVNFGMVEVAEAAVGKGKVTPFRFAILTDAHLFSMDNHRFDAQMADAVDKVMKMNPLPDFVVYCGDIAQNGKDDQLRKGMKILSKLTMPIHVIPGEHDWYLDMGAAWRGHFGSPTWSFDHKGVHFIGMNSILVRDFWTKAGLSAEERMGVMEMLESPIAGPWGVREEQLDWLKKDVKNLKPDTPVVVFTHSPLWDYYPRWNFQTEDAPENPRYPEEIRARDGVPWPCAPDGLQQDRKHGLCWDAVTPPGRGLPPMPNRPTRKCKCTAPIQPTLRMAKVHSISIWRATSPA